MDDLVPEEAAAPAPELETTAVPAPEDTQTPETPAEQEAPKSFTQEELDAIVGKRLAREQRKWEREQQQRYAEQEVKRTPPTDIRPQDFASYDQYAEVLAEQIVAKRETAKQQAEILEAYHDLEEAARDKYDDFEQVAYNESLPVTEVMAQSIQASDVGPDVLYWLGSNPKEAARIARLSAILQAKEIGKIEASLAANPQVRKTSTAPAPIAPVTPRASGSPTYDTTDPRSIKSMSTSEWIEADRQRQMKRYEAQRNR